MNKKYILLDSRVYTIECHRNLHQLQAIRDFRDIKAGDLGEICSYSWNKEKNGWDFSAFCRTCEFGWTSFIPYKE